jgi:hypothetical protein
MGKEFKLLFKKSLNIYCCILQDLLLALGNIYSLHATSKEKKVLKEKIETYTCDLSINLVFQQSFNTSREILQNFGVQVGAT